MSVWNFYSPVHNLMVVKELKSKNHAGCIKPDKTNHSYVMTQLPALEMRQQPGRLSEGGNSCLPAVAKLFSALGTQLNSTSSIFVQQKTPLCHCCYCTLYSMAGYFSRGLVTLGLELDKEYFL